MARSAIFVFQPTDPTGSIATAQSATTLTLNGAYVQTIGAPGARATLSGFQRVVTLSSAGDNSAVNVTIAGTTWSSAAVSQTISGPNAGTVSTTTQFMTVSSIVGDGAMTSIIASFGGVGQSRPFIVNRYNTPAEIAMQVTVGGTIAFNVRSTLDDVQTINPPTWVNHPTMSGTATRQDNYTFPPSALQINTTSAPPGGSLVFSVNPTGR